MMVMMIGLLMLMICRMPGFVFVERFYSPAPMENDAISVENDAIKLKYCGTRLRLLL
jgi:hypothetical protein